MSLIPLSLIEVCEQADVTPRTVRYYIQQGLLAPPYGAGQGAFYAERHVERLRVIKALQRVHLPLAEIRTRLQSLTPAEVQALLPEPDPAPLSDAAAYIQAVLSGKPAPALMEPVPAPAESAMVRSNWDRYALSGDLELHVRRPLDRGTNRKLERLLELARNLLKESP